MPEPQPRSPGDLLRRMKALADEAGIALEPGMSYRELTAKAERVEHIVNSLYLNVLSTLNCGNIPDIKFEGEDAEWLRSAMRSEAPFQSRYDQTLAALAKEGIAVDFEEAGWDDDGNSAALRVLVEPTPELDEHASPALSM